MKDLITRILSNPHTSFSGFVWISCKLGSIWLPQYKSQFDATEAVAVGYGLFMAGDAKASPSPPTPPQPAPQKQ